jgi:uncharacterized protein
VHGGRQPHGSALGYARHRCGGDGGRRCGLHRRAARLALQPLPPVTGQSMSGAVRKPILELCQSRQRRTGAVGEALEVQVAQDEDQSWHGGIVTGVRLVLDSDPQVLTVRSYARGEIDIGGQKFHAPCIVSGARVVSEWAVQSAESLDLAALEPLLALHPKVVLIGSDAAPVGCGAALRRALEARGIAFEMMNLGAACRTYNVLAHERREVVAGLFP